MTVRTVALALTGAAAFASVTLTTTGAGAAAWIYQGFHANKSDCDSAGKRWVSSHRGSQYKCEYDYSGQTPGLALYTR